MLRGRRKGNEKRTFEVYEGMGCCDELFWKSVALCLAALQPKTHAAFPKGEISVFL